MPSVRMVVSYYGGEYNTEDDLRIIRLIYSLRNKENDNISEVMKVMYTMELINSKMSILGYINGEEAPSEKTMMSSGNWKHGICWLDVCEAAKLYEQYRTDDHKVATKIKIPESVLKSLDFESTPV